MAAIAGKAAAFSLHTAAASIGTYLGNWLSPAPAPVQIAELKEYSATDIAIREAETLTMSQHLGHPITVGLIVAVSLLLVAMVLILCCCSGSCCTKFNLGDQPLARRDIRVPPLRKEDWPQRDWDAWWTNIPPPQPRPRDTEEKPVEEKPLSDMEIGRIVEEAKRKLSKAKGESKI